MAHWTLWCYRHWPNVIVRAAPLSPIIKLWTLTDSGEITQRTACRRGERASEKAGKTSASKHKEEEEENWSRRNKYSEPKCGTRLTRCSSICVCVCHDNTNTTHRCSFRVLFLFLFSFFSRVLLTFIAFSFLRSLRTFDSALLRRCYLISFVCAILFETVTTA